jgi:hypothetical protein
MSERITGVQEIKVTVDDIVGYSVGSTLKDEPAARGETRMILGGIFVQRMAHEYDLLPIEVVIEWLDWLWTGGGFTVEAGWYAPCDQCGMPAIRQERFSVLLCEMHYHESMEQHHADLENDDRAIGLIP